MPAHARVVFWDFDGTLARRSGMWSGALVEAMMRVDPSTRLTVEHLRPHLGRGFPWHQPMMLRAAESAAQWWAAMHPVFEAAYVANGVDRGRASAAASLVPTEFYRPDAWKLIDGAYEALLLTADAGFRNIVLSNHAPELATLVDRLGIGLLVEETITSASVGAEKPNPAIFAFALNKAGLANADEAWMVGDNPVADIEGASAVGIRAILVGDSPDVGARLTVSQAAALIVGAS